PPAQSHAAGGGEHDGAGATEVGKGLIVNYGALFEKAFAAWYRGEDGFLSCVLSFEDGALLIVPPLEDNDYRLVRVPKNYDEKVEYLNKNEDLAALMLAADDEVQKRGNKSA